MAEKEGHEKKKIKIKKSSFFTIIVIICVVVIAGVILYFKSATAGSGVSESLAKCIGQHGVVYVQLGCHFCAEQETLFGDYWQYLNSTDCYYNPQVCNSLNITGTPTWIINGKHYLGVQSIAALKNITGC